MKMKEFGPPGGGGVHLWHPSWIRQWSVHFEIRESNHLWGWLVKGLVNQRRIEAQYFVFQMRFISLY